MLGDLEGNPEPIEVKIFGDDLPTLAGLADRVAEKLKKSTASWTSSRRSAATPRWTSSRSDARRQSGVHRRTGVEPALDRVARQVATEFRRGDRLVDVRVRFADKYRFDLDWVREFPLTNANGRSCRCRPRRRSPPPRARRTAPRGPEADGADHGAAGRPRHVERGRRHPRRMMASVPLPFGYSWQLGGLYESQQASFRSLVMVLAVAVLLVFALLVRSSAGSRPPSSSCRRRRCRWSARSACCSSRARRSTSRRSWG